MSVAKKSETKHANPQITKVNRAPRAGPSNRNLSEGKRLNKTKFRPSQVDTSISIEPVHATTLSVKQNEKIILTTAETPKRSKQIKRIPRNYDGGNPSSYSLVTNYDQLNPKSAGPNPIQPLHITTQGFKKNPPRINEGHGPHKVQKHRIKLEKLPPNPTTIPETDWFDNIGKYHYGIIHGETYTEPPVYSQQRRAASEAIDENVVQAPPLQPKIFTSSFRDQKFVQPVIVNDHLGNFLYQSEVHYPSYRNHLYPPNVIYGGHTIIHPPGDEPSSKELPPPIVYSRPPPQSPSPLPTTRPQEAPLPRVKDESSKPTTGKPQLKQQPEEEEEGEEDEEGDEEGDDEDYDEESSEGDEEDSPARNVKRKEAEDENDEEESNDDDEEEEDDEEESKEIEHKPKYRFSYDDHIRSRSGEDNEFDRAWAKYGYGQNNDDDESGSYESSETVAVPQRIKFYHEIKEEVTTPLKSSTQKPPIRKITKVVSGKINHTQYPKKVISQEPKSEVKSQEDTKGKPQSSDAGSNEMKYFQ